MRTAAEIITRIRLRVEGVVQGVGFRPFVYQLALRFSLSGFVRNCSAFVEIEVQGSSSDLHDFMHALQEEAPPLAELRKIEQEQIELEETESFVIAQSTAAVANLSRMVPADAATCSLCLTELFNEKDRRFSYPFINCTDCGPRFSIIESLPYDREASTMRCFKMCANCQAEYDDPSSRRFHAQPNACWDCGPQLKLHCADRNYQGSEALKQVLAEILAGKIVAVKGLGGFHLVCDAGRSELIQTLRQRKKRDAKPFAVMMRDPEMVRQYCQLDEPEERSLKSPHAAIVLLRKRTDFALPDNLAPENAFLGVMLPYTPLQHLLLWLSKRPLVFTSANLSEEPIVTDNEEARSKLALIADSFLENNRDIASRYDDSVMCLAEDRRIMLRRSRGFAPLPLSLCFDASKTVLAFGAQLKNTFCFIKDRYAYMSQHIGDLENIEAEEFFQQSLNRYLALFKFHPEILACDLHPDYLSTGLAENYASKNGLPLIRVQHHHAHIASCMAENGISEKCIGLAFDGLGYGPDGALWGGEFFAADFRTAERLAHLEYVPMPGATQAILQPWRMGLSYALTLLQGLPEASYIIDGIGKFCSEKTVASVAGQVEAGINSPLTSSCGRLFDAVSSILGICQRSSYEGQAAIALEAYAWNYLRQENKPVNSLLQLDAGKFSAEASESIIAVKLAPLIAASVQDRIERIPTTEAAARFHGRLASLIFEVCRKLREQSALSLVCLSGGVFQNRLFTQLLTDRLRKDDFSVFAQGQVPPNDGGISLGQALLAHERYRNELEGC